MKVDFELPRSVEAEVNVVVGKESQNDSSISIQPKFFARSARALVTYLTVKSKDNKSIGEYALFVSGTTGRISLLNLVEVQCAYDDEGKASPDPEHDIQEVTEMKTN